MFFEQEIIENLQNIDKTKTTSRIFIDLTPISTNSLNTETNKPSSSHLTEPNDPREEENEPETKIPSNEASQVQQSKRSTRDRRANTRYSTNEFIFLECFEEAMVWSTRTSG
jgi:hypothetical protein